MDCLCLLVIVLFAHYHSAKLHLQSMIGRSMLEVQLRRIGIFGAEETINSHPNFDENFKICECTDFSFSN